MMRTAKRMLCALLAALMLASLAPSVTEAAGVITFTSVNDTLLSLSDETMPFWSGGVLYVASVAFDGTDLGLFYSRSRDKMTAVLYRQRNAIIFDLAAGTIETNGGQTYAGSAIVRGDVVFLPLDVICHYFGLEYSYTRISYGYLVRIKSDSVVLSDATFIDAAAQPMATRYNRYVRAKAEQAEAAAASKSAQETKPPQQQQPQQQQQQPQQPQPQQQQQQQTQQPEPEPERTVYFVIGSTAADKTVPLLARLSEGRAAYLFTPETLDGSDDLLRRLAAGGGAVALRVDASEGAESALAQIEAGNRAVWAAANLKTRLVRLDGASDETIRRVAEAGYCPLIYALDFSDGASSASRMSARILSAADVRGGSCCVYLGTDETASSTLASLLYNLRSGNCTPARVNEVVAS